MGFNGDLKLTGVIPPMITPLTAQGDVDTVAIERLVEFLVEGGVSGIFVLGTSGECPWLTTAQQRQVIQTTKRALAGRVPLLVGALEPSTPRTLEAMHAAEEDGADVVVVGAPYYYQASERVIFAHLRSLAAEAKCPLFYYNIPVTTHNPLSVEGLRQLLDIEQVVGLKDSTADWEHFEQILKFKSIRPEFRLFQGAERLTAKSLFGGADGAVPGLGNIAPVLFVTLYKAAQAGNWEQAQKLQGQIDQLWELFTAGFFLNCIKYAAAQLGFGSGMTIGHGMLEDAHAQEFIRRLLPLRAAPVS